MTELLDASLRFPTIVFTVGLGIALLYWLFVLLGAVDIDLFGGDVAGAGKGGAEALKGFKPDLDSHGGFFEGLGLAAVPITISFSVVMLLGWVGTLLGMSYGHAGLGGLGGWLGPLVLLVVILVGVPLAGLVVRPLGPVFEVKAGKANRDYVGAVCTVTTGHVDDGFGQATVEDGGTVLVIPVRCDRPGALARNQRAVIIDYDDTRAAYVVEPESGLLP